ncbi:hypothetical protein LTR40_013589, partial [Exophiala xenobiotica]
MPPRDPPFSSKYSHAFSASYLESLRSYRPARPTGSRPPPFSPRTQTITSEISLTRSDSAPTVGLPKHDPEDVQPQTIQKSSSFSSAAPPVKGRPLAQPPGSGPPTLRGRKVSPTATVQISHPAEDGIYVESVSRRMEKEEAQTLRDALEYIDHKDEETKVYSAAQDEA